MKQYPLLILISIVLLSTSCKSHVDLQNYYLEYINATIKIPASYINMDHDTIVKRVSQRMDSSYVNYLIKTVLNKQGSTILADTTNYHKIILISPISNYVEIDSNSFYYSISYQRKNFNNMYDNDSAYFFGSKMGSVGDIKYIDSEYLKSSEDSIIQCIFNSYIISTIDKSLGICFYSPYEQDVGKFINSITMN
jgi:hypothetical protein